MRSKIILGVVCVMVVCVSGCVGTNEGNGAFARCKFELSILEGRQKTQIGTPSGIQAANPESKPTFNETQIALKDIEVEPRRIETAADAASRKLDLDAFRTALHK